MLKRWINKQQGGTREDGPGKIAAGIDAGLVNAWAIRQSLRARSTADSNARREQQWARTGKETANARCGRRSNLSRELQRTRRQCGQSAAYSTGNSSLHSVSTYERPAWSRRIFDRSVAWMAAS